MPTPYLSVFMCHIRFIFYVEDTYRVLPLGQWCQGSGYGHKREWVEVGSQEGVMGRLRWKGQKREIDSSGQHRIFLSLADPPGNSWTAQFLFNSVSLPLQRAWSGLLSCVLVLLHFLVLVSFIQLAFQLLEDDSLEKVTHRLSWKFSVLHDSL